MDIGTHIVQEMHVQLRCHTIARSRMEIAFLINIYSTKLQWCCVEGHEWFASFSKIKNNRSWCPECSNGKPYTLEYVKQYAYKKMVLHGVQI